MRPIPLLYEDYAEIRALQGMADDFNDNSLDPSKWSPVSIGIGTVTERNARIEFYAPTHYTGGAIKTAKPHDITDARIKAQLFSNGYVNCCISIVPYDMPFLAQQSEGYTIGIWQSGLIKLFIYRNGAIIFEKETLRGNPENIEVVLEGGTIRFYEAGIEVYSEAYGTYTKSVNVYLWGVSWYTGVSGTSWADNFSLVSLIPPEEPSVDITSVDQPAQLSPGGIPSLTLYYYVTAPNGLIQLFIRIYDIATGALVCETGKAYHGTGSYSWTISTNDWLAVMPDRNWNLRIEVVRWWA